MFPGVQELRAGDGVPEYRRDLRPERAQVDQTREVAVYHLRHRGDGHRRRRNGHKARRGLNTSGGLAFAVGDVVQFTGNVHYTNANAASGKACKPGKAKVTMISKGTKHPYHLVKESGGGSTVYGWVNAADVQSEADAAIDKLAGMGSSTPRTTGKRRRRRNGAIPRLTLYQRGGAYHKGRAAVRDGAGGR